VALCWDSGRRYLSNLKIGFQNDHGLQASDDELAKERRSDQVVRK